MKCTTAILVAAICAAAALAGVHADAAFAAADITNAGRNIGDTARAWAGSLFAGGTAIAACLYALQRKVGPTLVFAGMALLVGGFIFAPSVVQDASESLWKTVLE